MIRQDGLLGACFDRRTTSPVDTQPMDPYLSGSLTHKSAMDHMTDLILRSDIVADESDCPDLTLRRDLAHALDNIKRRTKRENTHPPEPADIQYQCQVHHLELQFGFVKAWICRPALRNLAHLEANALPREVVEICLQSLRECLYAFVKLNSLCDYPLRSWSVIHNGLSSSLLLALTGEMKRDSQLHTTLGELLDMFEVNYTTSGGESCNLDVGTHLSPAYTRAIVALRKMYLRDGNIVETGLDVSAEAHSHDTATVPVPM